ncbi:MAG: Hpt domain-containing protein, partial [Polaromonas sp.]
MVTNSTAAEPAVSMHDLGPLAWVLDELRKSLEGASKALKRFAWDADIARGSDLAAIDASQLRIARQQLHQAVGALEVVGLTQPALLLRAMEAAVQKFIQQPELCSQNAVAKIEYASFALTEYLQAVLADKPVSAVSLFPQYRDVQELVRADRIHPADLWSCEWRWLEPQLSVSPQIRPYDADARASLDQSVLQLMKGKAPQAARSLRDLSLGFAANQTERQPRIFWLIAAAYFEAVAHNLLGTDLYVRRAASRILLQYASLSKGDIAISERLALDLLFFCAQAVSSRASDTPALSAVRFTYGLTGFKPVDYELVQFGRFDPALLAQARKRIVSAKEAWSSLCTGEIAKLKLVADQFSLVADSLRKLHAPSEPLAQALTRAIETALRTGQAPAIALAMEVATSVLYLEAVFEDLDPADPQLALRTASLAERLEGVRNGGEPQPLQRWMEELYRRVSDKQTMGSVVSELRVSLGELEQSLDLFFRHPQDKTILQQVPGQLSQMRGVLSVLGLDQASRAILHMKDSVEQMLDTEIDAQLVQAAGTFERLGNNLGALSFLIDMLNYQPALAKKLFIYDEEKYELKSMMGRAPGASDPASSITVNNEPPWPELAFVVPEPEVNTPMLSDELETLAIPAETVEPPVLTSTAHDDAAESISESPADAEAGALTSLVQAPGAQLDPLAGMDFEEDDLRDIFLEEAGEVTGNAVQAMAALANDPEDIKPLTVLRRAFHTLKGSARMVGLGEFGEAAWAMEQLLNSWLADQKNASQEFRTLCSEAIAGFECWIADIAASQDGQWSAVAFCSSAEAMRMEGRYSALNLAGNVSDSFMMPAVQADNAGPELEEFDFDSLFAQASESSAASAVPDAVEPVELMAADFDQYFQLEAAAPESAGTVPSIESTIPVAELPPVLVEHEPAAVSTADSSDTEEAVKVIDGLRIGIPLYNVYLIEADEWSRRLVNEVAEWALESHQPISASTVAFAHSLAGSSATVGFMALSEMARSLEHALENSRNHDGHGAFAYSQLFVDASEDIRRLLHQFAAGFLKQSQPGILERLNQLEFSNPVLPEAFEDEAFEVFADLVQEVEDQPDAAFTALPEAQIEAVAEVEAVAGTEAVQAIYQVPGADLPLWGAVQAPVNVATFVFDDVNDDIDAVDAIDPDLFPIFEEECAELMPRLGSALREWAQSPAAQGARLEVLRVLHTLKGGARLAGAMRLGEMAHRIESEIASVGSDATASQEFEHLLTRFDGMQAALETLRRVEAMAAQSSPMAVEAAAFMAIEPDPQELTILPAEVAAEVPGVPASDRKIEIPAPQAMVMPPLRQAANASIRVRTQLLDRMVNQAGEVMITRSRLEAEIGQLRVSLNDMTGNLTRLRQQLRDIELQAETQMQSRLALAKEAQAGFDPLEFDRFTRVQELTRMMAESVNDVATVQRTL